MFHEKLPKNKNQEKEKNAEYQVRAVYLGKSCHF